MHYLLKSRKNQVIYLGQEIAFDDLKDACRIHKPDYIFTLVNEPFPRISVQQYVDNLTSEFPECRILLSGYQIAMLDLQMPTNVSVLSSLGDTIQYIDEMKARSFRRSVAGSNISDN